MSLQERIKPSDRILVVAPHPDDESIGCGGLLLQYGQQCDILLLTDGRKGYDSRVQTDENALAATRDQELQNAAELANVHQIYRVGLHDGTVQENSEQIMAFDISAYQHIFVPNHYERHKDHTPVLKLFQKMWQQQKAQAALYEYEVWSPLPAPTDVLDISDLMEQKIQMVQQHQSQIQFLDYEAMTLSLNRYRGAGYKTQYAEVFALVPVISKSTQLYHKLPFSVRQKLWKLRHPTRG